MEYTLCAIPGHSSGTAPLSVVLLRPALSSPEGRSYSSHQLLKKVLPGITARDYRTSPCGLTDNFPIELNSLTKRWQKAAALNILPRQTGEVNQTTGTTALQTQRGKGTSVWRKYPLFLCLAFSRSWTAACYCLLLRQCCLLMGCCSLRCKRLIIPQLSS